MAAHVQLSVTWWSCEKCANKGAIQTRDDEDVYSVRNRIAAAHAWCSESCADTHGLAFVAVEVIS